VTVTPGYHPLIWDDALAGRYWRWQSHFPEQYFTRNFGGLIARRLRPLLQGRRKVLDYGSGVGYFVPHLAALGLEVAAADHSEAAVAATNARNAGIAGFVGAASPEALVAGGRSFDAIVSIEVIEHLSDEYLTGFFASLRKLVAPDGIVIITTPNDEDLHASETYCPHCEQVFHRWQHLRSWTAESLAAAVSANGFAVSRVFTTNFAYRRLRDPIGDVKRIAKRLLGRTVKEPHLVCVARVRF
jgi:2-polyprenyl-3-methyl-5-hydroxy-6-metoxy-1,4-benzoquinol methylase